MLYEMQLREFQQSVENRTLEAWQRSRNVLSVLPTGGGKTALFSSILTKWQGAKIAVAHRNELVGQMSLSLGKWGIRHNIIASTPTVKEIIKLHYEELGKSFYDASATTACAGVDTLLARNKLDWFNRVVAWVIDEAHHVLKENKWGEATKLFPNAYGLGVTATPVRADGKGLGEHSDGVFHEMVVGPSGRELMDLGWLCDYEVFTFRPDDLSFDNVETGATGDYKYKQLREATHASRKLVGDVVKTYLAYARGKRGITFAVDVEQARELVETYVAAGVPAQLVTAKTPTLMRAQIIRAFREGRIKQLVNVDLFGEGFDVPGVEVVSMARKTDSFSLFAQQLGRLLRPIFAPGSDTSTAEGRLLGIQTGPKPKGILLDHVGNYLAHAIKMGLPEDPKNWTLDAREKRGSRAKEDGIQLTGCPECGRPYESFRVNCPHCGHAPKQSVRGRIEEVDGDLELLDREQLKKMLQEAGRIDAPALIPAHLKGTPAGAAIHKNHVARSQAQQQLRDVMAAWGGYRKHEGLTDREAQKKFYLTFGVDVLTAQTLGTREATELKERVEGRIA